MCEWETGVYSEVVKDIDSHNVSFFGGFLDSFLCHRRETEQMNDTCASPLSTRNHSVFLCYLSFSNDLICVLELRR